ncbi:MAG: TIGR00159 family protein [Candidatus Marinimicrobia bacterium]|nr:TIGR00159 family protein [Candidatus Neomarinimicrobiota bacterium]|tara:strand:+ start:1912 stop:2685 length:774 start_codon:yes stop_codon:yes gene_type:complete
MTLFKIGFLTITILDIVDILLVTWLFIKLYSYFRGTRAGQMLVGLIIILLSSFVFRAIGMSGMIWIIDQVQTVWVVAFVILFQPELRRLLIYVGATRFFQRLFRVGNSSTIDAVVQASVQMQKRGWGAIIVLQRDTGLKNIKEAATPVKAEVSSPLLVSIFNPQSPLHDGAVIIQNNIIEAAQCILPLTESDMVDPEMGTRHRAALGISEETDVIAIVMSEEKKRISVAVNGVFQLNFDQFSLKRFLDENLFVSSGE